MTLDRVFSVESCVSVISVQRSFGERIGINGLEQENLKLYCKIKRCFQCFDLKI